MNLRCLHANNDDQRSKPKIENIPGVGVKSSKSLIFINKLLTSSRVHKLPVMNPSTIQKMSEPTRKKQKTSPSEEEEATRQTYSVIQRRAIGGLFWDLCKTYLNTLNDDDAKFVLVDDGKKQQDEEPIVEFYASHNYISNFTSSPRILGRMVFTSALRKLNLSCNNLTKFPPMRELVNLKELILSNNKIEEMNEPDLKLCKHLERLDLKMNRITKLQYLPEGEEALGNNLLYLSLSCNQISVLEESEMSKCKRLEHFGFFGNLVDCSDDDFIVELLSKILAPYCGTKMKELWMQANLLDSVTLDENVLGFRNRHSPPTTKKNEQVRAIKKILPNLSWYNGNHVK